MSNEAPRYNANLRADVMTEVNPNPKARVHSVEWRKVMQGDPVEINPSVGSGMKVRRAPLHASHPESCKCLHSVYCDYNSSQVHGHTASIHLVEEACESITIN